MGFGCWVTDVSGLEEALNVGWCVWERQCVEYEREYAEYRQQDSLCLLLYAETVTMLGPTSRGPSQGISCIMQSTTARDSSPALGPRWPSANFKGSIIYFIICSRGDCSPRPTAPQTSVTLDFRAAGWTPPWHDI